MWSEDGPVEPNWDPGWDTAEPEGPWQQYAELLRRLDVVRAIEQARTAGIRASVAQMSEHADALAEYLSDQRETLMELARDLRYKMPEWEAIPPEQAVPHDDDDGRRTGPAPDPDGEEFDADRPRRAEAAPADAQAKDEHDGHDDHHPDAAPADGPTAPAPPPGPRPVGRPLEPATGLRQAAQLIDRATHAAEQADEAGASPAFLPHWSARSRNVLIYGLAALLSALLQAQLVAFGGASYVPVWVFTSVLSFGIGYFLVREVGAPRIGRRSRKRSARTGFAMCLLAGPILAVVFALGR